MIEDGGKVQGEEGSNARGPVLPNGQLTGVRGKTEREAGEERHGAWVGWAGGEGVCAMDGSAEQVPITFNAWKMYVPLLTAGYMHRTRSSL